MKVISSWDDGTVEDLRLAQLLKEYGIEAIFYFPAYPTLCNEPKGRRSLNKEQRQEIAKDFEIGSHTLTHPLLTRIPIKIAVEEIEQSKTALEDEFSRPVRSFAYPRGYANAELQMAVEEAGYDDARSTLVGYIHESENPYFLQTTVHVGNDRKEYGGLSWLEYAKSMLNQAINTKDSVFHIWGHSWEIDRSGAWYDLEELLKEIHEHPHS